MCVCVFVGLNVISTDRYWFRLSKELMIRSKPRKSKAESQRRGGKRGVCHTEHALCTNFLLSSS